MTPNDTAQQRAANDVKSSEDVTGALAAALLFGVSGSLEEGSKSISDDSSGGEAEDGHSLGARERANVVNKPAIFGLLGSEVRAVEVKVVELRLRGGGALKHDAFVSVLVALEDAEMLAHLRDTDLVATIVSPAWSVDKEAARRASISGIGGEKHSEAGGTGDAGAMCDQLAWERSQEIVEVERIGVVSAVRRKREIENVGAVLLDKTAAKFTELQDNVAFGAGEEVNENGLFGFVHFRRREETPNV